MADRSPSGKNLVLVADDEGTIVRMATTILSGAGFRAVVVSGGNEGVRTYREFQQEICLVLADVVMPDGGGLEIAQAILELDPKAKILFMSGYSDAALEVKAQKRFPFIRKPFLPDDLIRKIREVLGATENLDADATSV
jgi:two-component system cell cycle sensor histidine kinase/response regulator CckA